MRRGTRHPAGRSKLQPVKVLGFHGDNDAVAAVENTSVPTTA